MSRVPSRARTRSARRRVAWAGVPYSAATRQSSSRTSPRRRPAADGTAARRCGRSAGAWPAPRRSAGSTPAWSGTAINSSTPRLRVGGVLRIGRRFGLGASASTGPPVRERLDGEPFLPAVGAAARAPSGSPASTAETRFTRSATREPAPGRPGRRARWPRASASVRRASSSRVCSCRPPRRPRSTVAGSSRSRRVAVSMSSRWWRTRVARTAVSRGRSRSARPRPGAMVSPATEWSPGQPLPMSCSSAATRSRSGRWTRRVNPEAAPRSRSGAGRRSTGGRRCAAGGSGPAPSRAGAGDQPLGLQRLPDLHGGPAPSPAGSPAARVPRRARARAAGARWPRGVARRAGRREPGLRRGGRGTQREHGVAVGARGAGEHHLAVLLDDAPRRAGSAR